MTTLATSSAVEFEEWYTEWKSEQVAAGHILFAPADRLLTTEYAKKVINGQIIASKKVVLAAKRHLNDLKKQGTKHFPWIFVEETGHRPIRFIEKFCKPSQGDYDQLVFQPWQHFCIGSLFGWVHKDTGIRRFREGLIFIGRKNGKALALDTPIDTPSGWKTMGELQKGDFVYSVDGKPTRIIATSEVMYDHDCYKVTFEDGEEIVADADHIWTVVTKNSRRMKRGYFDTTTKEMLSDFVRVRPDGKGSEYKYRVPVPEAVEYEDRNLDIHPYMLGVWLGDGYSAGPRIILSPEDSELLDNIYQVGYGSKVSVNRDGNWVASIIPRDGVLFVKKLRSLNVLNNKHIPESYLRSSVQQRMELLRGLMDTDGYAEKRGQCEITQKNKVIIDGISELLSSLAIKHTVRQKNARCNGKDAGTVYTVLFYVSKENSCFKLTRKHERLKDRLASRMSNKSIVSIEAHPSVPVKCIAVEHESKLYLAGKKHTATHNTTMISGVSNYAVSQDGESGARVYLLSNAKDQAKLLFDESKAMVEASPTLRKNFVALRDSIKYNKTKSKIEARASDSKKLDGLNTHLGVFDEIHEFKDYKLINVIKKSRGSRKQPLILYITTAGYQLDGPLINYYEQATDVLDGVIEDERTFYFMAELDSEEEFDRPDLWIKANPSMGVSLHLPTLREDWEKDKRTPAERSDFITKQFNIFVDNADESFLDFATLKKNNKVIDPDDLKHIPCVGGFDLSDSEDFTSACLEFPIVETGEVFVLSHTWVPYKKVTLDNEKLPFREYEKEGLLTIVKEEYIRKELVYDWFVEQSKKYIIELITYDPAKAFGLVESLNNYGFKTEVVRQGSLTLGPAVDDVKERFIDGNVIFNNNRLFRWYVNNVKMVEDRNRNKLPTKIGRYRKIDGFAAFLNAHTEVMKKMLVPQSSGNVEFLSISNLLGR